MSQLAKTLRVKDAVSFLRSTGAEPAGLGESIPEVPVRHFFTPGLYGREAKIPQGCFLVTKIHKQEHQFILSKGSVLVNAGGDPYMLEAPYHGVTKPGTQRVIFALEDTIWTTFHPTDLKDVVEIEKQIMEMP